ncbi:MAG: DNA-directed RNA polymerase subunit alpha [Gemmatimonadetes bacterium]|nr:DNA-directed RNA polymerase subunit alpha [Gemmatimonadota bacterium]MDA1104786.1 DNA-directed RNA polymerase subunit alpha [Gemmatimonadota bacterium]
MEIDLTGLVLPERVESVNAREGARSAQFVIEPLERGFGHTLGNSVRRVLLSSLRGSAVWAFRTDGVVHEHQTIQGVVEDVHQVIQNLKSLVVTMDDDVDDCVLTLKADKPGAVTAGMIQAAAGAEIMDADHHLFTLQEKRSMQMELHVNKGRGFVLADQHAIPRGAPVDLVRIDSIYNPVRRANFAVEETRVGQRTDFDRLTLSIETDGSIEPEAAVAYAAELVRKHLEYMLYFGEGGIPEVAPVGASPVPERLQDLFERPIEDLAELSVRSRNSLQKESIRTLGDLVQRSEDAMLQIENFGKKSLKEISDFLEEHSLRFGMQLEQGEDGRLFFVEDEAEAAAGGEE